MLSTCEERPKEKIIIIIIIIKRSEGFTQTQKHKIFLSFQLRFFQLINSTQKRNVIIIIIITYCSLCFLDLILPIHTLSHVCIIRHILCKSVKNNNKFTSMDQEVAHMNSNGSWNFIELVKFSDMKSRVQSLLEIVSSNNCLLCIGGIVKWGTLGDFEL